MQSSPSAISIRSAFSLADSLSSPSFTTKSIDFRVSGRMSGSSVDLATLLHENEALKRRLQELEAKVQDQTKDHDKELPGEFSPYGYSDRSAAGQMARHRQSHPLTALTVTVPVSPPAYSPLSSPITRQYRARSAVQSPAEHSRVSSVSVSSSLSMQFAEAFSYPALRPSKLSAAQSLEAKLRAYSDEKQRSVQLLRPSADKSLVAVPTRLIVNSVLLVSDKQLRKAADKAKAGMKHSVSMPLIGPSESPMPPLHPNGSVRPPHSLTSSIRPSVGRASSGSSAHSSDSGGSATPSKRSPRNKSDSSKRLQPVAAPSLSSPARSLPSIASSVCSSAVCQDPFLQLTPVEAKKKEWARSQREKSLQSTELGRRILRLESDQHQWLELRTQEKPRIIVNRECDRVEDPKAAAAAMQITNLCRLDAAELVDALHSHSGSSALQLAQQFPQNSFVVCGGQRYGYIRYVGRVPFERGLWVGVELTDSHELPAPLVDFHAPLASALNSIAPSALPSAHALAALNRRGSVQLDQIRRGSISDTSSSSSHLLVLPTVFASPGSISTLRFGLSDCFDLRHVPASFAYLCPIEAVKSTKFKESPVPSPKPSHSHSHSLHSASPHRDRVGSASSHSAASANSAVSSSSASLSSPSSSVSSVPSDPWHHSALLRVPPNPWCDVDDLALNCPQQIEIDPEELAKYLSDFSGLHGKKGSLTHQNPERARARAIFRWICNNIRFDYHAKALNNQEAQNRDRAFDPLPVLKHRRGTAEAIAQLFVHLCQLSGLQSFKVRGIERVTKIQQQRKMLATEESHSHSHSGGIMRGKEKKTLHYWNLCRLDGDWQLIDCALSSGYLSASTGAFERMFSEAYWCTSPEFFLLTHWPIDCSAEDWEKALRPHRSLQLIKDPLSEADYEAGLFAGRATLEHRLQILPASRQLEVKQSTFRIEISGPKYLLYEAELQLRSLSGPLAVQLTHSQSQQLIHSIDFSQCCHIQYLHEGDVRIHCVFPIAGVYSIHIGTKPAWKELDVLESVAIYQVQTNTGIFDLVNSGGSGQQERDLMLGFIQPKRINSRDSRALLNRQFTVMHPVAGYFQPNQYFVVQIHSPPDIQSVIFVANGHWQRLNQIASDGNTSIHSDYILESKSGFASSSSFISPPKVWEGRASIPLRGDIQIFYEQQKKYYLLYYFKGTSVRWIMQQLGLAGEKSLSAQSSANSLGIFNPVGYLNSAISPSAARRASLSYSYSKSSPSSPASGSSSSFSFSRPSSIESDCWDGKCQVSMEGRAFDATLALDLNDIRLGPKSAVFFLTCSSSWEVQAQCQAGWKNGQPISDSALALEEIINHKGIGTKQWRININLKTPNSSASTPTNSAARRGSINSIQLKGVSATIREEEEEEEIGSATSPFSIAISQAPSNANTSGDENSRSADSVSSAVELNREYLLVVNVRNSREGGPFRFGLSYYFLTPEK